MTEIFRYLTQCPFSLPFENIILILPAAMYPEFTTQHNSGDNLFYLKCNINSVKHNVYNLKYTTWWRFIYVHRVTTQIKQACHSILCVVFCVKSALWTCSALRLWICLSKKDSLAPKGDQRGLPGGSHWMRLLGELFKWGCLNWETYSSCPLDFCFLPGTWLE